MIFGEYPCCDGHLCLSVPDVTPAYLRQVCPHCGEVVWHILSRLDPESMTESAFLAKFDVDYETKRITAKNKQE